MTDFRFLSCDEIRKEIQSTRRGYKPRKCKAELSINTYHQGKRSNEDLRTELKADKLRREVNTSMLYRWFKAHMKDVLRT